jgi:hypothetical protein
MEVYDVVIAEPQNGDVRMVRFQTANGQLPMVCSQCSID